MKVLVCADEYYPNGSGIANVAHAVVEEWKRRGLDVTVCSPTGPDIAVESLSDCGYIGLLNFWEKVNSLLSRSVDDFDLVWMHNPVFLREPSMRHALTTIHSTSYGRIAKRMHPLTLHTYYRLGTIIDRRSWTGLQREETNIFSAISGSVQAELRALGISEPHMVPNGVDTSQFHSQGDSGVRERLGIPEDAVVLIAVGRLTAVKMHDRLIRAFDLVQRELRNAWLLVVGGGELLEPVREMVHRSGASNVAFAGHVPHDRLPDLYAAADFYVMSSSYEGQPLTLLEAMASGLPCIVSDIPGLGLVSEARCGTTIDFREPAAASRTMLEYVLEDRRADGARGREHVQRHLDWGKIADRYLGLMSAARGG